MNQAVTCCSYLTVLSATALFIIFAGPCSLRITDLYKNEPCLVFGATRQATLASEFLLVPDQMANIQVVSNREAVTANNIKNGEEIDAAIRNELANLTGKYHDKAEWTNSGFRTISSLLETYYWAMREGNLDRWMECMSPKELATWQSFTRGKRDVFIADFIASLKEVQGYQFESAAKFRDLEYIITAKHTLIDGTLAAERFAVLKTESEWKICGNQGMLKYQHHPADISKYDALAKPPDQR